MRGDLLVLAAVLAAGPAAASPEGRIEAGAGLEVTLGGLAAGGRAELLLRPGATGSASRLRVAAGFLEGPEFHYVPFAVGYRALYRPRGTVHPLVGGGLELQQRWVSDAPVARQLAVYVESGALFDAGARLRVGLVGGLDWTVIGGPGPGIVLRLEALWRF